MRFDFHHFHHADATEAEASRRTLHLLGIINGKLENIMATLEEVQAGLAVVDTKVAAVKTDVETLLAKVAAIPVAGLTPEQQAAIDDIAQHVQGIATSLGAIDTEVNPPTA